MNINYNLLVSAYEKMTNKKLKASSYRNIKHTDYISIQYAYNKGEDDEDDKWIEFMRLYNNYLWYPIKTNTDFINLIKINKLFNFDLNESLYTKTW